MFETWFFLLFRWRFSRRGIHQAEEEKERISKSRRGTEKKKKANRWKLARLLRFPQPKRKECLRVAEAVNKIPPLFKGKERCFLLSTNGIFLFSEGGFLVSVQIWAHYSRVDPSLTISWPLACTMDLVRTEGRVIFNPVRDPMEDTGWFIIHAGVFLVDGMVGNVSEVLFKYILHILNFYQIPIYIFGSSCKKSPLRD